MNFESAGLDEEPEAPLPLRPSFAGAFGAWMHAERKERGLTQATLAARSGLSRCWWSNVENGHVLPQAEDRDRIIVALGARSPVAGQEAWNADRLERGISDKKANRHPARRMSQRELRDHGALQRVRILQRLVDDLFERTGATTVSSVAERLGMNKGSVSAHLRKLANEGLVETRRHSWGTAYLLVTVAGYQRAVTQGELSGTWAPPYNFVEPVLVHAFRNLFEARGILAPSPAPPPPLARAALSPSGAEPVFLGRAKPEAASPVPPLSAAAQHRHAVMYLLEQRGALTKEAIEKALDLAPLAAYCALESLIDDELIWWVGGGAVAVTDDLGRAWLKKNPAPAAPVASPAETG